MLDQPPSSRETRWGKAHRRIVRWLLGLIFLLSWLAWVGRLYYWSLLFEQGSLTITPTHTERIVNHGEIVYITPAEQNLLNTLHTLGIAGSLTVVGVFFIVHFLLGVKLIERMPTLSELLAQRQERNLQ